MSNGNKRVLEIQINADDRGKPNFLRSPLNYQSQTTMNKYNTSSLIKLPKDILSKNYTKNGHSENSNVHLKAKENKMKSG